MMSICASAVYAEGNTSSAHPREIDSVLVNPDQGWGLWAGHRAFLGHSITVRDNTEAFGDDAPLFSFVLVDWMWADLEPEQNQFRWADIDAVMNYWARRGKQVYLRVWVTDDTGWNGERGNEAVPEWVWKAGAKFHVYEGSDKSVKREPDYADASYANVYLPRLRHFLEALSNRYDGPVSPVSYWGVMGFGNWGEWHTLMSDYQWPSADAKRSVLTGLVNLYGDLFKKPKIIAFVYDNAQRSDPSSQEVSEADDFAYRQGLDVAMQRGFGMARHGFIDGLVHVDTQFMLKYWRDRFVMAEGDWTYSSMLREKTHGSFEENTDVMLEWHANWAHFYTDAAAYRQQLRLDRTVLEKALKPGGFGCRLVIGEAQWPSMLPAGRLLVMRSQWLNRNIGHCTRRYRLSISLRDERGVSQFSWVDDVFDPRSWLKDAAQSLTSIVPVNVKLKPGRYRLSVAVDDPESHRPIWLGIADAHSDGSYELGDILITAPDRS